MRKPKPKLLNKHKTLENRFYRHLTGRHTNVNHLKSYTFGAKQERQEKMMNHCPSEEEVALHSAWMAKTLARTRHWYAVEAFIEETDMEGQEQ